jgi:sphingomyelin phosphodiesterase acid-like 3
VARWYATGVRLPTPLAAAVALSWAASCTPPSPPVVAAPPASPAPASRAAKAQVLAISDLHYDPLFDEDLVPELVAAPASQWRAILDRSKRAEIGAFAAETNDALWKSTLAAMSRTAPDAAAIVISGDFAAHGFVDNVARKATGTTAAVFLEKTIALLISDLHRTFPRAQILPALGNNDAPCGDYMSQPDEPFLARFADIVAAAVGPGADASLAKDVSHGGYYAARVAFAPRLRLLSLNGALWSAKYKNNCGTGGPTAGGDDQMRWLDAQLDGVEARHEVAWVLSHIPVGLDVVATRKTSPTGCENKPVTFYSRAANEALGALLAKHRAHVGLSIVGHVHMHELRALAADTDHPVAEITVPAVSTLFQNDPSFVVLDVNPDTLAVTDVSLYALPFRAAGRSPSSNAWRLLYDFDRTYGEKEISGASVVRLSRALTTDKAAQTAYALAYPGGSGVDQAVAGDWATYACAQTHLDVTHFALCRCPAK